MIKRELHIFLTAVMFYTRIPCPKRMGYSDELLNKATRYFPVIGWIVGAFTTLVFWAAAFLMPKEIAIILSMAAGIMLTGAFHEDGFADVCDGFGGGYSKSQILTIMKDSRNGTYGTVGLVLMLLFKFLLLNSLSSATIILILPVAHTLSRFAPVLIIFTSRYSRDDELSKSKPIGKALGFGELLLAIVLTILPGLLLFRQLEYAYLIIPVLLAPFFLKRFFEKHLDGYTGDCLGATQQITEVSVLLTVLILFSLEHIA